MASINSSLLTEIKSLKKQLKEKQKIIKSHSARLRDSNERIERIIKDLHGSATLIRNIHKTLLPVNLPKIPHFTFSYKLNPSKTGAGGDFLDVIPLQNPLQFGILLSGFRSFTLSSLFLSVLLKSFPSLKGHKTAEGFLTEIFKKFPRSLSKKEDISVFYGIVNRRDFTLSYCLKGDIFAGIRQKGQSAGKPAGSSRGDFQTLSPSSLSVSPQRGKNNSLIFKSRKIELSPGDCLALCSPGLFHRKNPKGEIFGAENIIKSVLSPANSGVLAVRQNILFQAHRFAGSNEAERDQTVLIMKAKSRVLKLAGTNRE